MSNKWDLPSRSSSPNVISTGKLSQVAVQSKVPSSVSTAFWANLCFTQLCPTLRNPMDCSPPGPTVCGIFQARIDWSGLPFPLPGDLPDPGIEPMSLISPALQADSLPSEPPGKLHWIVIPKHCMRINRQLGEKTASTVYLLASGNQQSDHTSLYPKNESHKAVFLHRWDFIKIFVSFSLACHQPSPWWS